MRSCRKFLEQHAQRLYGALCGGSNLLLLAKGAISHDPMIAAGAYISLGAQAGNAVFGEAAKPLTAPALVFSGVAFAASGLHVNGISVADATHIGFGFCKIAGISALFYGRSVGEHLQNAPSLRFAGKVLRSRSETVGEAFLAVAASSMALDGVRLLESGWRLQDDAKAGDGGCTLVAMGLFLGGNHVRAMRPAPRPQ